MMKYQIPKEHYINRMPAVMTANSMVAMSANKTPFPRFIKRPPIRLFLYVQKPMRRAA